MCVSRVIVAIVSMGIATIAITPISAQQVPPAVAIARSSTLPTLSAIARGAVWRANRQVAADSTPNRRSNAGPIVAGMVVGAAVGFIGGGLLSNRARCGGCAGRQRDLNRYLFRGALVGTVAGGVIVWGVSARR